MNRLPLALLITFVAASVAPLPSRVLAGGSLQRCSDAGGATIYTDRSCAALGGRPVPLPAGLIRRIAVDASAIISIGRDAQRDRSIAIVPRSRHGGCARTKTQLTMDLQSSLATNDVNRLAESYHWVGRSHAQAGPLMRRLEAFARRPLLEARFFDARIGVGAVQLAGGGGSEQDAGIMQLSFGEAQAEEILDLRVLRYSGCYFLRF